MNPMDFNNMALVYDSHRQPHSDVTVPQLTLVCVWLTATLIWILRRSQYITFGKSPTPRSDNELADHSLGNEPAPSAVTLRRNGNGILKQNGETVVNVGDEIELKKDVQDERKDTSASHGSIRQTSGIVPGQQTKSTALSSPAPTSSVDDCLKHVILLGALMLYVYLCDYRKIFPAGERVYDRDTLLFLLLILFVVGLALTLERTSDQILNRNQTEEWRGWMQVMFVWYHYFAAKEWYNWIRIYISCYVWMTGFGNFSFFWIRKDYSLFRVVKMLFRLDFSVLVICAAVSNAFMVYYICAMHTYWFLSVYAVMAVFRSWNDSRHLMAVKFAVYAAFNAVIFDIPSVGGFVFRPLTFIVGMQMPVVANATVSDDGVLHEWMFRVGLDHWSCLVGMLCAYNYPHLETFMRRLEADRRRLPVVGILFADLVKAVILVALSAALVVWYVEIGSVTDKHVYNRLHPYTSPLPIVAYAVIRNLWPTMRTHYIGLFARLGKLTLETYLCQLHVYLQSNAYHLIVYIAGYPLINFSLATVIYLFISDRLFHVTNTLSSFLLPSDIQLLLRRCAKAAVVVGASVILAIIVQSVVCL